MIHVTGKSLHRAMRLAIPYIRRGGRITRCINEHGIWTISIITGAH